MMEPEIVLQIAFEVVNDTMWTKGLVLLLLVSGTLPTFAMLNKDLATQKERMDAL